MKNSEVKKSIIFMFIIIIVVALIGIAAYFILDSKTEETPGVIKTVNEIKGYNIHLRDTANEEYKKEFLKLKDNLDSSEVDYDEYAESVAKMFVMDLYTMTNKINKYDVGGVEFVMPSVKDNYILNVTDTIYNYLEDNSNGRRKQSLPEVKNVVVEDVKKDKFTIKSTKEILDSYTFNLSISYKNDLGYDKKAEIIVVKSENFMYVVEKN